MTSKGKAYIQGPAYYKSTAMIFSEYGYEVVPDITEADIVVLTGGEDINPAIYGQKAIRGTYFSSERDQVDLRAAEIGYKNGKFLAGICRGAQLLNCWPNEGTLWQDVDRHAMGTHRVEDLVTKKSYPSILSVHHQMMRPTEKALIVGVSYDSTYKIDANGRISSAGDTPHGDIEVLWYPETKSLCFQSHPEFGHHESSEYFFELLDRYYISGLYQG